MATDLHGLYGLGASIPNKLSRMTDVHQPSSMSSSAHPEPRLKHAELTERILSVFYSVYNELGYGFLESVYEESMVIGLRGAGLTVDRQAPVPVWFRGNNVGNFRADILVNSLVLLELKSARCLDEAHEAQLLHYLRSTDIEVGMLLNFGLRPQFKRLLFDNERKKIRVNPCKSVAGVSV